MLGRVFNRSWHRHRFFLHYGYLASTSISVWMNTIDGVAMSAARGYVMRRAGWIIAHSITLDVTAITGGNVVTRVSLNAGVESTTNLTFDSSGFNQRAFVELSTPIRFEADDYLAARAVATATITFSAITGVIEIEMER